MLDTKLFSKTPVYLYSLRQVSARKDFAEETMCFL
jgi:hypothetical protein